MEAFDITYTTVSIAVGFLLPSRACYPTRFKNTQLTHTQTQHAWEHRRNRLPKDKLTSKTAPSKNKKPHAMFIEICFSVIGFQRALSQGSNAFNLVIDS